MGHWSPAICTKAPAGSTLYLLGNFYIFKNFFILKFGHSLVLITRNYGGRSRQDATPLELELDIASVRESTRVCYADLRESARVSANLSKFAPI